MSRTALALAPVLLGLVVAQSPDNTTEVHPKLTTYKCTTDGGCVAQTNALVLEASQHNIYQKGNPDYNCGDWGSPANATVCPDEETCQQNCILEGISDYSQNGVVTDGSDLTLHMFAEDGASISPRIYLLNEAEDEYEILKLTGQEFTFDVDMSKLPCGMNSAVYFSEMEAKGGQDSSDIAVAGAPYGTGYCDAQCYTTPFQNGVGNINGSGVCCNELDIWEANSRATHLAPHTCNQTGLYLCDTDSGECDEDGVCDKSGCSMNPYKMGYPEYYGRGDDFTVDTTRPFTVVTQFNADESNTLISYTRLYVQDNTVFEMPSVNVSGTQQNVMDDAYCTSTSADEYLKLGATAGMGESMDRGSVLVFSLWADDSTFMEWLDQSSSGAGPCNATEGNPTLILQNQPDAQVTFSNLRWGDIGATFAGAENGTNGTSLVRRRLAAPFFS